MSNIDLSDASRPQEEVPYISWEEKRLAKVRAAEERQAWWSGVLERQRLKFKAEQAANS